MGIPIWGSMVALDKRIALMLGKTLPYYYPDFLAYRDTRKRLKTKGLVLIYNPYCFGRMGLPEFA